MATSLQRLEQRGHWGIKRGLHNIRALLEALGHPEQAYPAVLIAGMFGFHPKAYFVAKAGAETPPEVKFDFGKKEPGKP